MSICVGDREFAEYSFSDEEAAECNDCQERRKAHMPPNPGALRSANSRAIFDALYRVSVMLEANDSSVDDLIHFLEGADSGTNSSQPLPEPAQISQETTLGQKATQLLDERTRRFSLLPKSLREDRIVSILLSLYAEWAAGRPASSKSVGLLTGCPDTTALRCLGRMEEEDLVTRSTSTSDRRVTQVSLTSTGQAIAGKLIQIGPN